MDTLLIIKNDYKRDTTRFDNRKNLTNDLRRKRVMRMDTILTIKCVIRIVSSSKECRNDSPVIDEK